MLTDKRLEPPLAVSFDLDGTLLDGSHLGRTVTDTCRAIAARKPDLDADELTAANSRIWEEYFPMIEDDWALGLIDSQTAGREAWRRTLQACGVSDEHLVEFARQTFATLEYERVELYEDVLPLISALAEREVPLALVTNGASETQRGKLAALGIEDWFDVTAVSSELGIMKPDPAIFEYVLESIDVDRRRVWHIGDWVPSDVAGARGSGLTAVWINRSGRALPQEAPRPHMEVGSLADLIPRVSEEPGRSNEGSPN
jgi:putative hydrolase of the HAD superfamily